MNKTTALYYLPCLVRSDRYFIARLEAGATDTEFNFVVFGENRVFTPILSFENPDKIVLNQMALSQRQDLPLKECRVSMERRDDRFVLLLQPGSYFSVEPFFDAESGLQLDYSAEQGRIFFGFCQSKIESLTVNLEICLKFSEEESYSGHLAFCLVPARDCHRVVLDFGSEASQIAYRHAGPQSPLIPYDILENISGSLQQRLQPGLRREEFLNHEPGQPLLYRSFYAVKKKMSAEQRENFPFNFCENPADDELRLYITRQEVAASEKKFLEDYEIIPNLKLGIEKSLQLSIDGKGEDYSIREYKKELIAAILLRLLRLMISTKPGFQRGGLIVTLLVPNIYTQRDVFELLDQLRKRTGLLLASLGIHPDKLQIEYETISESDAAFMGYQQTHAEEARLANGEIALVIDCGKGTTDISMLLADENENYSSFFRTGFAGAGNVLLYGFVEDFLTLALKAIPGSNAISVKEFINRELLHHNLTADVLDFIGMMEDKKRKFSSLAAVGINEFSQVAEQSVSTERVIGNLYKDPSTLLSYATTILSNRNIRWDEELTGLIEKAVGCISGSIISSIRDVVTRDIRKRIKLVMLSGRAFYFSSLEQNLRAALQRLLGEEVRIKMIPSGRTLNNKNIALHGAFSGAYKITDFTGIPIDRKEGLSRNKDVVNNNQYLYRGIKIQPGNDISYNAAIVRRNNQELIAFRNKTVDIFFTRDNIYLRMMENQRVKYVRSLCSLLTSVAETYSSVQDMKAMSMFPSFPGEMASVQTLYEDIIRIVPPATTPLPARRKTVLQFFQF